MTKKLLMGNEAFAHAALEAGVSVVAGYPGTPSSELIETVARLRASGHAQGVHVEWSTNEKAALEICAAASMSGARALFTCKQVGLNVASDALMSLNYVGVRGGLVLFVADDPGPISSQTEQDTRRFAEFAKVPVLDPATPEQGYTMMKAAFELSEEYGTPVIVRPTTRINHASTFFDVADNTQARALPADGFKHDPERWVIFPKRAYEAHGEIIDRLNSMTRVFAMDAHYSQFLPMFEKIPTSEDGKPEKPYLGIFTGGVSTQYALEALDMIERRAERANMKLPPYRFMQMGIPYPFAKRMVRRFMDGLSHILVLEELDSVLEEGLMVTASGSFLSAHVHGKLTGEAPDRGENTTENAVVSIAHFFDMYTKPPQSEPIVVEQPKESKRPMMKEKRASHRLPDHVREEEPVEEPRIGLIGVAADYHASQQAETVPERIPQKRAQSAASRRQAQSAARRRQTHAARYKAPSKSTQIAMIQQPQQERRKPGEAVDRDGNRLSILRLMEDEIGKKILLQYSAELPSRQPVLCAGCPHRGSFYAVKGALDKMGVKRENSILCGDIGCYTLGNAMPLNAVDTCLCMGGGITMAQGFHVCEPNKKQVAFVGDSTFFASAMTGIANAVYNDHDVTFVILDNSTTAMTGSQPHPGTGDTLMGQHNAPISIEGVLQALGVEVILFADPLNRAQAEETSMVALRHEGPSAIIFRSPCVWLKPFGIPAEVDPEECTGCKRCITDIGCPAIGFSADARGRKSGMRGQAVIDTDLCNGCGLCLQVCPFEAIRIPSMLDFAARDAGSVRLEAGTSASPVAPSNAQANVADIGNDIMPAEDVREPIRKSINASSDAGAPAEFLRDGQTATAQASELTSGAVQESVVAGTEVAGTEDGNPEAAASAANSASTPSAAPERAPQHAIQHPIEDSVPETGDEPASKESRSLTQENNPRLRKAAREAAIRAKAQAREASEAHSRRGSKSKASAPAPIRREQEQDQERPSHTDSSIDPAQLFGGTFTILLENDADDADESEERRG